MVTLTLSGPRKNALGTELLRDTLERVHRAGSEPLLLTGEGDAFSSGLDLSEVASLGERNAVAPFLRLLEACMSALYLHPGPTVAAVNGHAIAGGCVLALCCDHRVMTTSPRARMGLTEVVLGLRFPPRVFRIVRERVPRQSHAHVVLGGDLFDPATALRMGLVDEVSDDPMRVATARLDTLARLPPEGYAAVKRDLRGAREQDLASDADLDAFLRDADDSWGSPALPGRIAALLARPRDKG